VYSYNRTKTAAGDESLRERFQQVMEDWLKEFSVEVQKFLKTRNMTNLMRHVEVAKVQAVTAREMGRKLQVSFDGAMQRSQDPNSNEARFIGHIVAEVKPTHVNSVAYKVHVEVIGWGSSDSSGNMTEGPSAEAYRVVSDVAEELGKSKPDFWQHI